jgi:NAD(P)-dependent dehydrogenase (short-subunit alcohol dehydrogenase family)
VLVGRDATRTEAAVSAVRAAAPNAKVEWLKADLTSLQSVRELAAAFKARYPRLDVLLNNAGPHHRPPRGDGGRAGGHHGHQPLRPLPPDEPAAGRAEGQRPVAHHQRLFRCPPHGKVDFEDLQSERGYSGFRVYGTSKLANILFTRALAKRLQGTGVTANALHPGVVRTGFGHNAKGFFRHLVKLAAPFMISAEKGARTSVYLASSPEVESVSGEYFYKLRPKKTSSAARDDALAERLWQVSEQLTGVKT